MIKYRFGFLILSITLLFTSCNKDFKDLPADSSVVADNDVISDSYSVDLEDITSLALLSDPNSGGREQSGGLDDRFTCANITRTPSTTEQYSGTIEIDFGTDGCKDSKGNIRKGKMIIAYKGKRYLPGSKVTTNLENYSINNLKVEGVRATTFGSASKETRPVITTELKDGKVTWPDGTFSTHDFVHTRTWYRETNPAQDYWTVTGSGKGTTKKGVKYDMVISKDLLYKKQCEATGVFIAVSGIKTITKEDKNIVIDYGNSICNNLVTVTSNGVSKVIEIHKKGL